MEATWIFDIFPFNDKNRIDEIFFSVKQFLLPSNEMYLYYVNVDCVEIVNYPKLTSFRLANLSTRSFKCICIRSNMNRSTQLQSVLFPSHDQLHQLYSRSIQYAEQLLRQKFQLLKDLQIRRSTFFFFLQ